MFAGCPLRGSVEMAKPARSSFHGRTSRPAQGRTMLTLRALLAVGASLLSLVPGGSSASAQPLVSVRVTASPASGGTVAPGALVTYRLHVESRQPLPAGAAVVDDLEGLLDEASMATPPDELAKAGLTLSTQAKELTWLPPSAGPGGSSAVATTSCQGTGADDAPDGAKLITAAALAGEPCGSNDPCATTFTVHADPPESPVPDSPTPSDPATSQAT